MPSCAFAAAFSASSKTKFLSDSTSLGPDNLYNMQKERVRSPGYKNNFCFDKAQSISLKFTTYTKYLHLARVKSTKQIMYTAENAHIYRAST